MLVGLGLYLSISPAIALDMFPMSVNITITVSPLVPPIVTNDGGASNVLDVSARLNGEIPDTGNENPAGTVFYGASDGGTTPALWSDNVSLGIIGLGTFYSDVSGLSASTTYFYRMFAANSAGSDWADSTANFTTIGGVLRPPSGLTLTDLGGFTVTANWTTGTSSNYTLLRISRRSFPSTNVTDEFLYYGSGESCNITGWPLDTQVLYVSAWGVASNNATFSSSYETASIGGEGMTGIADAINNVAGTITIFQGILLLLPLIGFSVLAFWKENHILFMITAGIAIITGLNAPDILSGISATSSLGVTVGLMLILYALCCAGWAFKLMFWKGEEGG
jgi:hypothetical protein